MTDPEQLAPCPFASCGTPDVKVGLFGEHWRVFCRRCRCEGPGSNTAAGAIAEWNDRDTAAAHRAGRVGGVRDTVLVFQALTGRVFGMTVLDVADDILRALAEEAERA